MSLLELIRRGGFRRGRHAHLIASEPLPEQPPEWIAQLWNPRFTDGKTLWDRLRSAQEYYCDPPEHSVPSLDLEAQYRMRLQAHRDYLDAFSRGVRALHTGAQVPWLFGELAD
jgi:hypothetical protein